MEQFFKLLEEKGKKALQNQKWRTTPEKAIEHATKSLKHSYLSFKEYPNPLPEKFKPIEHPNPLPNNLREMIIGLSLGQAVGDCIGICGEGISKSYVQYFFSDKEISLYTAPITEGTVRFMNENFKLDDWTDDTDQMILILDSLVRNNGTVNVHDFAQRMKYWGLFGFSELGDLRGLGYGSTFHNAVSSDTFLENPIESTQKLWDDGIISRSTDGSVMRTSIAAVPYFWNEDVVVENARTFGIATHPSLECQASVTVTVLILAKLLQGRRDIETIILESYQRGVKDLKDNKESIELLKKHVFAETLSELILDKSMSHTMKPMACAIFALKHANQMKEEGIDKKEIFRICMTEIIMEGGDTDTNCAVAGAVIGCYLEGECIPDEWMDLKHMKWYKERINRMLRLYELEPMEI